jgi:hypothetical protein
MPQVTLSVTDKKLPLVKNILTVLGISNKSSKNFLQTTGYQSNSSASQPNSSNSFLNKNVTWEYFSNELEFE